MEAVARFFVIAYRLPGPTDIELNSTAEPPWDRSAAMLIRKLAGELKFTA
jgi:hypothetical protein